MPAPMHWIRQIGAEIRELNTIPLFGNAPPFEWDQFSAKIKERLSVSEIKIACKDQVWQQGASIKKGFSSSSHLLSIQIAPLGKVYWMMSNEDLLKLTSFLMRPHSKHKSPFSTVFQEGFYRFIALNALDLMQEMAPFAGLTLQLHPEEEPIERAFCIDIEIHFAEKSCWGRLILPEEFRAKWIQHFSHLPLESFSKEKAERIPIELILKTGSVILHQEEWARLKVGDFVLLDQGSYDAHKRTGTCLVMLQSTPLFNAKIKQGGVEILDYAFYYEDNMEKNESFPEAKEAPSEGEVVAIKELPLYVTVEIARMKMSLGSLMNLAPGNTLELPVHPDNAVSLTVNGKTVGRAELVHLGERLGVRILEI